METKWVRLRWQTAEWAALPNAGLRPAASGLNQPQSISIGLIHHPADSTEQAGQTKYIPGTPAIAKPNHILPLGLPTAPTYKQTVVIL